MGTSLSDLQKARLIATKLAGEMEAVLGPVVSPRFFCCTAGNVVGVVKEPVAVISLSPTVICVNDFVTYDGRSSYDPDGTVTQYSWTFGDSGSSSASNGTHQYTSAGTYTVTLKVKDGTNLWGSASAQVVVNESLVTYIFLGHKTAGCYYQEFDACSGGTWEQRNTGLTGNWLNVRDLKMDPFAKYGPVGTRHVWIATQAGVAKSEDDMVTWSLFTDMPAPRNTAEDSPAPTISDLDWYCIAFNPQYSDEVYILAGTATRAWIYWTENYGITWDNWQVSWS